MVFITVLCLISFDDIDDTGIDVPNMDKAVHFVFYFVAAFLGACFARERRHSFMALQAVLLRVVAILVIYGIIIEVLQLEFTTTRSAEVTDVLANTLGALSGAAAVKLFFSGKWPLKWKN